MIYECPGCLSQFAVPRREADSAWYSQNGEFYGWRWEFDLFLDDLETLRDRRLRILEIGCGEGALLERLSSRNEALGLDMNAAAVEVARRKRLQVLQSSLESFRENHPEERFHVIVGFHVLEHLGDPSDFLRQIAAVLMPGGQLFLSVPNPERCMLRLGREEWDYPPHHLTRFSKEGIARLLERAGYEIVKRADQPPEEDVIYLAKIARYRSLPLPKHVRELVKLPVLLLLEPFANRLRSTHTGLSYYVVARRLASAN